jgi:hypothetical protein
MQASPNEALSLQLLQNLYEVLELVESKKPI